MIVKAEIPPIISPETIPWRNLAEAKAPMLTVALPEYVASSTETMGEGGLGRVHEILIRAYLRS